MGNPVRFFGDGHPYVEDDFILPPRCAVEVTFRTHQQQYLLRPDGEATEIILGCFGRAHDRYPDLELHALNVLSDHGCFLATPSSAFELSSFMRDFMSTAGVRLNRLRGRSGTFWERRYRAIPVVDEPKLDERFAYVLTQGTKENLLWSARDWPGISSIGALFGERLVGRWRDRRTDYERDRQRRRRIERAAARGEVLELPTPAPTWIEYPIHHTPLPHWKERSETDRREHLQRILDEDDRRTRERHERDGTCPVGHVRAASVHPFDRPDEPKKSPAPLCHASTDKGRRVYRNAYAAFVSQLRSCVEALVQSPAAHSFPAGQMTPPLTPRPPALPVAPCPSLSVTGRPRGHDPPKKTLAR